MLFLVNTNSGYFQVLFYNLVYYLKLLIEKGIAMAKHR